MGVALTRLIPVYQHTAAYSIENHEEDLFSLSYQTNIACMVELENLINESYNNNHLDCAAIFRNICSAFSIERVTYILANTLQYKDWDIRFSRENRAWAKGITVDGDRNVMRYLIVDQAHPGLVDLFVSYFRKKL